VAQPPPFLFPPRDAVLLALDPTPRDQVQAQSILLEKTARPVSLNACHDYPVRSGTHSPAAAGDPATALELLNDAWDSSAIEETRQQERDERARLSTLLDKSE
jgi:hypothetical protein